MARHRPGKAPFGPGTVAIGALPGNFPQDFLLLGLQPRCFGFKIPHVFFGLTQQGVFLVLPGLQLPAGPVLLFDHGQQPLLLGFQGLFLLI
jgi:hypothetical protein